MLKPKQVKRYEISWLFIRAHWWEGWWRLL